MSDRGNETDAAARADVGELVRSNNAFGLDLFHSVRTTAGNLFFSPFSIWSALTMVHSGARANTQSEIATTLHLALPHQRADAAYPALARALGVGIETHRRGREWRFGNKVVRSSEGGVEEFKLANRLWGSEGAEFLPAFLEAMTDCYQASLGRLDFVRDPESARAVVNEWVAEKTHRKIAEVLTPGALEGETRLLLTSASYFLRSWEQPFEPEETDDAPFFAEHGVVNVPTMHGTERFRFAETDQVQVLELDYFQASVAAWIILPRTRDGLPQVERTIDASSLETWSASLRPRDVAVGLPRFRMTSKLELREALRGLGIRSAFKRGADFSGASVTERALFLNGVVHGALVDVDERGTEAAAATVGVMLRGGPPNPIPFVADHPFLFVIRDSRTGCVLFLGRVAEPKA